MFLPWETILIVSAIILLFDWYLIKSVRAATRSKSARFRRGAIIAFWALSAVVIGCWVGFNILLHLAEARVTRGFLLVAVFIVSISKFFPLLAMAVEDLVRGVRWGIGKGRQQLNKRKAHPRVPVEDHTPLVVGTPATIVEKKPELITRSEFLSRTALAVAAVPAITMTYGIISGAHDYHVHRVPLILPDLPKELEGLKIGQLSDIHSGSFYNKVAVRGGVDLLLAEKPDLVCFTGDLVNNEAWEVNDYIDVFNKVKAPLGVYSVLGNHDYGDYMVGWSADEKAKNLALLKAAHAQMRWRLLVDEHLYLPTANGQLALVGIGNWGDGRFPKYGKMDKAVKNLEDVPVKILLSHDPSHWDAQVRPLYPQIDVQLAGHTHGAQFGIDTKVLKWSPVQYRYKQWAGLYKEGNQQLYVNRGYGYIGYPGRVGILPEVTVFTLTRG